MNAFAFIYRPPVGRPRLRGQSRLHRGGKSLLFLLSRLPDFFDPFGADKTIPPWAGWDEAGVDVFVGELGVAGGGAVGIGERGDRGFEPLAVLFGEGIAPGFGLAAAFGRIVGLDARHFELGLVVGAATFVSRERPFEDRLGG